jgi:nitrogen fixation-related uncharacterized protein
MFFAAAISGAFHDEDRPDERIVASDPEMSSNTCIVTCQVEQPATMEKLRLPKSSMSAV